MRKNLTILFVVALGLFWVGFAFAQSNANAYFKLDVDLATKGFQDVQPAVTNIGATTQVGFAVYSQAWDNAKGFTVKFEWDAAKATFRDTTSNTKIVDDPITINGKTITPPAEANILVGTMGNSGLTNTDGLYTNSYFLQGGSAATTAVGLIYFAVFRTASTFKTSDVLSIKASVTVSDDKGVERFLGTRYFNVNQVAVKDATWGDVKNKFKDF